MCVCVFYCQKNCSDHLSKETHGILSSARFPEIHTHTHTHTHREWAIFPFRVCVAFQFHILFQVWKANRIWAQVTSVSFPEIRSLLFWLSQTEGITHPWPVDMTFFCGTWKEMFSWMFTLPSSKSIMHKDLRAQIWVCSRHKAVIWFQKTLCIFQDISCIFLSSETCCVSYSKVT